MYHPVIGREQASRKALRHLVNRFFGNSPELLVLNLLKDEEISEKELKRIRKLITGGEK
jgi:predicted transcriptional regulator